MHMNGQWMNRIKVLWRRKQKENQSDACASLLLCYGLSVPSTVFIVPVCTGTGVIVFFYRMFGLHSVCCAVYYGFASYIFFNTQNPVEKSWYFVIVYIIIVKPVVQSVDPSSPVHSVRSSVHTKYVLLFFILSHSTFLLLLLFSFHLYLLYSTHMHISSFTIETWFSSFRQVFRRWYSTEDRDEDVRANDCFLLPLQYDIFVWLISTHIHSRYRFFFTTQHNHFIHSNLVPSKILSRQSSSYDMTCDHLMNNNF